MLEVYYAVAAIAARVSLLMALWPALRLAAAAGFGQALYDAIASRRSVVPVGACDEAGCPR